MKIIVLSLLSMYGLYELSVRPDWLVDYLTLAAISKLHAFGTRDLVRGRVYMSYYIWLGLTRFGATLNCLPMLYPGLEKVPSAMIVHEM